jgi:hypothetical protein
VCVRLDTCADNAGSGERDPTPALSVSGNSHAGSSHPTMLYSYAAHAENTGAQQVAYARLVQSPRGREKDLQCGYQKLCIFYRGVLIEAQTPL